MLRIESEIRDDYGSEANAVEFYVVRIFPNFIMHKFCIFSYYRTILAPVTSFRFL